VGQNWDKDCYLLEAENFIDNLGPIGPKPQTESS
jgi:hypothetical protein